MMSEYYLERGEYRLKIDERQKGKFTWRVWHKDTAIPRESGSGTTLFDAWQKGIKALDNAVNSQSCPADKSRVAAEVKTS